MRNNFNSVHLDCAEYSVDIFDHIYAISIAFREKNPGRMNLSSSQILRKELFCKTLTAPWFSCRLYTIQ